VKTPDHYKPTCPKCGCDDNVQAYYLQLVTYAVLALTKTKGGRVERTDDDAYGDAGDVYQEPSEEHVLNCGDCGHAGPEDTFLGVALTDDECSALASDLPDETDPTPPGPVLR
jgi:hypothetical protein